ncbi:MAG: glycosyltransferase family 2 protein [Candidatus Thermoplasmatota archaeon]
MVSKNYSKVEKKKKSHRITLSIIIVNWNNKDILRDCLNSIYHTPNVSKYEIIVVDNHSEDGSVELIKNKFVDVKLIENNKNLGFAKANNQAIKIARGDYILLLNNDTVVTNTYFFDRMIEYMKKNPQVGILGCKLLHPDGTLQSCGGSFPSVWGIFKSQILFTKTWKRLGKSKQGDNHFKKVDFVCGACLMTRKEILDKVGLLKEEYFMYGEDVEFCYRVRKVGYDIGVLTDESIIHLHSKSTEKNLTRMLYHSITNDLKNIWMLHHSNLQVLLVKIFHLMGILMRAFLAIFRKGKKPDDYLKLFKRLLVKKNK